MSALTTSTDLRAEVGRLDRGQKVRATFADGVTGIGVLGGVSLLDPANPSLWIDAPNCYRNIRNRHGNPGPGLVTVQEWDDDARFDRCMEAAQDWVQLQEEAEHCPKSEQGWRALKAEEAKQAFVDEWLSGEIR